jgi:hypothetical protein
MKVSGYFDDPATLPPGKKPLVPIGWRLGGSQSPSRRGGEEKNSQPRDAFIVSVFQCCTVLLAVGMLLPRCS